LEDQLVNKSVCAGFLLLIAPSLLGCSAYSLVDAAEPTQEISIVTTPPGAHCVLFREDKIVAEIKSSPEELVVDRSRHDMKVVCKKEGYQEATENLRSGIAATPFWDIIELNASGLLVNAVSGADNSYPGTTTVTLVPIDTPETTSP
jgi:hypothetical protein